MMKFKLATKLFVISVLFWACQSGEALKQRWTEEQARQWMDATGWLRGANFIPATAINQLEMWQSETFDPTAIDRELSLASSIGFNAMRVYLHHKAWLQDPEGFKNRMEQYLEIADRHQIKTIFVFFDDCWNRTSTIGAQPDPKPGVHNSGWLQDPGYKESADTTVYPVLEKYVKDVLNHFYNDNRIVLWDLYNEPGNSGKADTSLMLLKNVFLWARSTKATYPIAQLHLV